MGSLIINRTSVTALAVVIAMLAPLVQPIAALAQQTDSTTTLPPGFEEKLRVHALLLQELILRARSALNITNESLLNWVDYVLSVNVSQLDIQGLQDFIANATELLKAIREQAPRLIPPGRVVSAENLVRWIADYIYKKIEKENKTLAEEFRVRFEAEIRVRKGLKAVEEALKEVEARVRAEKAEKFFNATLSLAKRLLNRSEEVGEAKGIQTALQSVERALQALNATLQRLQQVNASAEAIEAVAVAISRIQEAKQILANLSNLVPPGLTSEEVKQRIKEFKGNLTEKLLEEINDTIEELSELRELAVEANASEALEIIDNLTAVLGDLQSRLLAGDVALGEALEILAKVKAEIRILERYIGEAAERLRLADKIIDRISYLREKLSEINSTVTEIFARLPDDAVMPAPATNLLCAVLWVLNRSGVEVPLNLLVLCKEARPQPLFRAPELVSFKEMTVSAAREAFYAAVQGVSQLLDRAESYAKAGNYCRALYNLGKATALINTLRMFQLELSKLLKVKSELSAKIDELEALAGNISAKLSELKDKALKLREAGRKMQALSMLAQAETLINQARIFIARARLNPTQDVVNMIQQLLNKASDILKQVEKLLP